MSRADLSSCRRVSLRGSVNVAQGSNYARQKGGAATSLRQAYGAQSNCRDYWLLKMIPINQMLERARDACPNLPVPIVSASRAAWKPLVDRHRYEKSRELWVKANPAGRSETSNDPGWAQPESKPSPVWLNKASKGPLCDVHPCYVLAAHLAVLIST